MEYPSNRVNWSSIFTCALIGSGIALILAMVARAVSMASLPEGTVQTARDFVPLPFGWPEAVASVIVMGLAFGAAGFATSVLARFPTRIEGLLHAVAGFMLAAIAIHFMARGALFAGRPGFPWDLAVQPEFSLPRTFASNSFLAWVTALSAICGLAACCGGAWAGFTWVAKRRPLAPRKDDSRRAA